MYAILANGGINRMKQISREEAEQFFQEANPRDTRIEQKGKELQVSFILSDDTSILVIYNTANHRESYFLEHLSLGESGREGKFH